MKKLFLSLVLVLSALSSFAQTPNYLTFTAKNYQGWFKFETVGTTTLKPTFQYSTDGATWINLTYKTQVTLNVDVPVYIRGDNPTGLNTSADDNNYNHFLFGSSNSNCRVEVSGNIMSLLDPTCASTTISTPYALARTFNNCNLMTTVPELPATTLAVGSYSCLFTNCTNLQETPELPATIVPERAYNSMFWGCSSLVSASPIHGQSLGYRSYRTMFYQCTKLKNVPDLECTNLSKRSCEQMFSGCSALEKAPYLPATTLADSCYLQMFQNCTNLHNISVAFDSWTGVTDPTKDWVENVAPAGRFIAPTSLPHNQRGKDKIPTNWQMNTNCLALTANASSYVTLNKTGNPASINIEYSINGGETWQSLTVSNQVALSNGQIMYIRGTNFNAPGSETTSSERATGIRSNHYSFNITGSVTPSGNIMSLLDNTGMTEPVSLTTPYCFAYLFDGSTGLKKAPNLPFTTLSEGCYYNMFENCSSMTSTPMLPALQLTDYCYFGMFWNCDAIATPPELPAEELKYACYNQMFGCCDNITTPPTIAATAAATSSCYRMFYNCSKLTKMANINATIVAPWCFQEMYKQCPQLTTVYDLPASKLARGCYYGMFTQCTQLTSAPAIAATELAPRCCYAMFDSCVALTNAPTLAATTLADSCYMRMFYKCTALNVSPTLSATVMAPHAYNNMFYGCTSLTTPSNLPALTMQPYCYRAMYSGCTSLQSFPQLPATALAEGCYYNMFYNCSNATGTPELPATQLVKDCYYQMFYNCSKLKHLIVEFSDWNTANSPTTNWVYGVGIMGNFEAPDDLTDSRGVSAIPESWQYKTDWLTLTANSSSNISLTKNGSPKGSIYCNYNGAWQDATNLNINLAAGASICFRGQNETLNNSESSYWQFGITGSVNASGNIMSLLDNTGTSGLVTISQPYCFYSLFNGCKGLETAPKLPATTLSPSCYRNLFCDCSALTTAPDLPALEVPFQAYRSLFNRCSKLKNAPQMDATKYGNASCWFMFQSVPLNEAPAIHAVEVGDSAFMQMFNLSSVTEVPQLELPELRRMSCYQMFNGCSSLQTVDNFTIAAVGDSACAHMFQDCAKLTSIGEDLNISNIGIGACKQMFKGCSKLVTLPSLPATTLSRACYYQMFYGCAALTTAPTLPATTLADSCYYGMFYNCKALETPPTLPATTMVPECYREMFRGSGLRSTPALPATSTALDCYRFMFAECTNLIDDFKPIAAQTAAESSFRGLFYYCTNLENSPVLAAIPTGDSAYQQTFYGCSSLRKIHVAFDSWYTNYTNVFYTWVKNVPQTAGYIFVAPDAMPKVHDENHIPNNWNLMRRHTVTLNLNNHASWDGTNRADSIIVDGLMTLPNIIPDDGYTFLNWNTKADGTGEKVGAPGDTYIFTEDKTIYAAMICNWADNIEILNWTNDKLEIRSLEAIASITTQVYDNATPDDMTHGEPLTAVENNLSACQITGDVATYYINYNASEVASHPGNVLVLTVKDAGGNTVGTAAITIPVIVSGEANISSYSEELCAKTDIQITNGGKLTVDADRTTNHVKIQGGGKLVVPAGQTLTLQSLTMQGGAINNGTYSFTYPQLVANGNIDSQTDTINYDYLLDASQYYTLALPYDVTLSEVTYRDGAEAVIGLDGTAKYDYKVQYYDGQQRTTGVSSWKALPAGTTQLNAGQGYTIFAKPQVVKIKGGNSARQKYAILRLPMHVDFTSINEQQKTVSVTAYGEGNSNVKDNDKGWNLVGNPYLANFTSETGLTDNGIGQLVDDGLGGYEWKGNTRYVIIPSDNGQFYSQVEATSATLPAFKNFFVQIGTGDALNFTLSNRAQNAPSRAYMTEDESTREYMADITISNATSSDHMGVIVSQQYTDEYEINADLAKWINNGLNIYALSGADQLAYIATNEESALNIPVGVAATVAGTYTISLTDKYDWSQWKAINLYDATTRQYINLLQGTYTFTLSKGMFNNRFSLTMERNENASVVTGSSTIHWNEDAPVQVYDMLGRFMGNRIEGLPSGVYNIRQGEDCQSIYIW